MKIVTLASASPRRRDLLAMLLKDFEVSPSNVSEKRFQGEEPLKYVARMANEKAEACSTRSDIILGADTIAVKDGEIFQKPSSKKDAMRMLNKLIGKIHHVITSVAVRAGDSYDQITVVTEVEFANLSLQQIESYLGTDEPWDSAGAYSIQGLAGSFVKRINGSYTSVVGLPLFEVRMALEAIGVEMM